VPSRFNIACLASPARFLYVPAGAALWKGSSLSVPDNLDGFEVQPHQTGVLVKIEE
jgi:hypothetical protein